MKSAATIHHGHAEFLCSRLNLPLRSLCVHLCVQHSRACACFVSLRLSHVLMLLIASNFASCVHPLGGGCLSIKGPFQMALLSFACLLWLFCFFLAVIFCISVVVVLYLDLSLYPLIFPLHHNHFVSCVFRFVVVLCLFKVVLHFFAAFCGGCAAYGLYLQLFCMLVCLVTLVTCLMCYQCGVISCLLIVLFISAVYLVTLCLLHKCSLISVYGDKETATADTSTQSVLNSYYL